MTTKFPKAIARAAFLVALLSPVLPVAAQTQAGGSSARNIQTDPNRADLVAQRLINEAEGHYRKGLEELKAQRNFEARNELDKAVDVILEAGYDVRGNTNLQRYYSELVEKIARLEAPENANTEKLAMLKADYEPGNLDELSQLELTPQEQAVTQQEVQDLQEVAAATNATTNLGFTVNPLILQYINYYQGRGRQTMIDGLQKSGQFVNMARRIFREEGVPEDIVWLGQVESAWKVRARSWASAVGLWQFIPGTGTRFGLRQTAWLDERSSYEKATRASARYLKFLANRYNGNWELAMAAYNTGEGNIDRAISRAGVASFWAIYPYIAQETRNYVPNIMAVIFIAKNPEHYGFGNIPRMAPLQYATVQVPGSVSFRLVAAATGVDIDAIRYLNPELKRDQTPPGENYVLNIPAGREKQFVSVLTRIPVSQRDNVDIALAAPGETLEAYATRLGLNLEALKTVNQGIATNQPAGIVIMPRGRGLVQSVGLKRTNANGTTTQAPTTTNLRVNADMSLQVFATNNGYDINELTGLNGFPAGTVLKKGQTIKVPARNAVKSTR